MTLPFAQPLPVYPRLFGSLRVEKIYHVKHFARMIGDIPKVGDFAYVRKKFGDHQSLTPWPIAGDVPRYIAKSLAPKEMCVS